jgi:DNA-binding transcriptional LysR family regulator
MTGRHSDRLPFDLRSLEIFLAVCKTGAMGAAARLLNLTQPAVSQAVADIEKKAGVLLFNRSARPLGLTPAGAVLQQRATALMDDALEILPTLREMRQVKLPFVRVGLIDSLSRSLMRELSSFLMGRAVKFSIVSGLALQTSALLTRRLDVVLSADDLCDTDGLERWPILEEPFLILCSKKLSNTSPPIDLNLLAQQAPLLRFPARSRSGAEIDRHLRRLRIEIPRIEEFDTAFGLTAAVAAGLGWAITTPLCTMEAELPLEGMDMLPLPGPRVHRNITLVAHAIELGTLPSDLAKLSCGVLGKKCGPFIARHCSWVGGEFVIGEKSDRGCDVSSVSP